MKFYFQLTLLFLIISCYSPKRDIETDKHPEIPAFPTFKNNEIILQKVSEFKIGKDAYFEYLIKENLFFIYIIGKQDINDHYNSKRQLITLSDGKFISLNTWKDNLNVKPFIDGNRNIYIGNHLFYPPKYTQTGMLYFKDLSIISKKYQDQFHLGESEKDSVLIQKIRVEEINYQKSIFDSIDDIHSFSVFTNSTEEYYKNENFICNLYSGKPFYLNSDFFNKIESNIKTQNSSLKDSVYFNQLQSKIKRIALENQFKPDIDSVDTDINFFKESDKIVTENYWFNSGNHFVASFGYRPIYMYYYDVVYKNIKTKTKVDYSKESVSNPIKVKKGLYFIVENFDTNKLTFWLLKSK
jgi:hypothetical protein